MAHLANMITNPTLDIEITHWSDNRLLVGGVDEAGRGALAGPIIAACVILPPDISIMDTLKGVRDSKAMSARNRSYWAEIIRSVAISIGVGSIDQLQIDEFGIQPANQNAMVQAMLNCDVHADHFVSDFVHWKNPPDHFQRYKKGESVSLSIAAASIIAKTTRDVMMEKFHQDFPQYGFDHNKGYGTKAHMDAINRSGPCRLHRKTFLTK